MLLTAVLASAAPAAPAADPSTCSPSPARDGLVEGRAPSGERALVTCVAGRSRVVRALTKDETLVRRDAQGVTLAAVVRRRRPTVADQLVVVDTFATHTHVGSFSGRVTALDVREDAVLWVRHDARRWTLAQWSGGNVTRRASSAAPIRDLHQGRRRVAWTTGGRRVRRLRWPVSPAVLRTIPGQVDLRPSTRPCDPRSGGLAGYACSMLDGHDGLRAVQPDTAQLSPDRRSVWIDLLTGGCSGDDLYAVRDEAVRSLVRVEVRPRGARELGMLVLQPTPPRPLPAGPPIACAPIGTLVRIAVRLPPLPAGSLLPGAGEPLLYDDAFVPPRLLGPRASPSL